MNSADITPQSDANPALSAISLTAFSMLCLAGLRSSDTRQHLLRVQNYVQTLAQKLQTHPRFAGELTPAYIQVLFHWVPLHGFGSVGIPDRVLLKPSSLTKAEYEMVKTHTTQARDAIVSAEKFLGAEFEQLKILKELVYSHHEKWDGSGYPQGLAGAQIPLSARLMALADVYDALISERVYRAGMPHDDAVTIICKGRASHFDPDMVDAFVACQGEFQAIAHRYPDTEEDMQQKIEYLANAIAEEVSL